MGQVCVQLVLLEEEGRIRAELVHALIDLVGGGVSLLAAPDGARDLAKAAIGTGLLPGDLVGQQAWREAELLAQQEVLRQYVRILFASLVDACLALLQHRLYLGPLQFDVWLEQLARTHNLC